MNKAYLVILTIIVTFLCSLYLNVIFFGKRKATIIDEKKEADTIILYKRDTIVEYSVKYLTKKHTDTLYLPSSNNGYTAIPIEQSYFSKPNVYDLWVSGYNVELDSMKTYPQIVYKTITNNTTTTVVEQKWNLYTYLGVNRFSNQWSPNVGIIAKSPKNTMMYGLELGLDGKSNIYYGIKLGYKIK